jgi:hypothetical protein
MSDEPLLRMFNYPDDLGNTPLTLDMGFVGSRPPRKEIVLAEFSLVIRSADWRHGKAGKEP